MIGNYENLTYLMFKENDLRNNLIQDGFFKNNGELHIIDNYNILYINDKAIQFYVENFVGTGCTRIIFYMEVKDTDNLKKYTGLIKKYGEEIAYLLRRLYGGKNKTKEFLSDMLTNNFSKVIDKLDPAIEFMKRMKDNNIDVYIKLYKLKQGDLKLHGRYWLSSIDYKGDFKAYMVDGSLNTYPHSLILAQLMNRENRKILKEYLEKELIISANGFNLIGLEDLKPLKNSNQTDY